MASADNVMVKIEVKASDLVDACIKALVEDGTLVEVVRCKDCKHRDDDDFCTGRGYPNVLVPDDGFCDKGERREDE